ncbi:MAG: AAA family ATPase, partial [archaeon]
MKIKSLELRGYQGFENLRIDFHNELTVIASRNEAIGKTTILDAISILIDNYIHIYNPKSPDICGVIEDENENKMKPLALYYDTRRNSSDIRSTFSYDIDSSKFIEDIMSRAKILNPYINDSLLPFINGIVLIDEIELHHHPSWQQKI